MDDTVEWVKVYASNFYRNITGVFDNMSSTRWLRMFIIVGAYLLFRPHLVKLGEKIQGKQYAKQMEERRSKEEEDNQRPKAKISPNALRGHVEEEEVEEVVVGEAKEGKKVRRRQKKVTIQEDGEGGNGEVDEAELLDQLLDYKEGEDGW